MSYEPKLKQVVLDILEHRMSSIADCIQLLFKEGYIPNQKKYVTLSWCSILINAYLNVDILTEEQQKKLDIIYNKVIRL